MDRVPPLASSCSVGCSTAALGRPFPQRPLSRERDGGNSREGRRGGQGPRDKYREAASACSAFEWFALTMMMMARQFWKMESLQGVLPLGAKGASITNYPHRERLQTCVLCDGTCQSLGFVPTPSAVPNLPVPRPANGHQSFSSPSLCTMSSLNIIRQASSARTASRILASTSRRVALTRSYATPPQEVDPQLDGYPQLPFVQRGTLPARGWDDMLERRNFGEPVGLHPFYQIPLH